MTEAGQIFALLRATSAAEIAKRFSSVDLVGGSNPWPVSDSPDPAPGQPQAGAAPARPLAGQGALATGSVGAAAPLPDPEAGHAAPEPDRSSPGFNGGPLRAAVTLRHLAPPRLDVARIIADGIQLGLTNAPGREAAVSALASAAAATQAGAGAAIALASGDAQGLALGALASGPGGLTGGPDGGSGARGAGNPMGSAEAGPMRGTDASGRTAGSDAATGLVASRDAGRPEAAAALAHQTSEASETLMALAARGTVEAGQTLAARSVSPAQVAAFAETMLVLLDPAGSARSTSVASGVIFNAAMIPGWPFPTAFARDGAEAINPKAMLHRLAATIEGMTPEQAAEYMAKIGGGYALLRNLRKLLKELDRIEEQDVKGLLFAFLETISTIASGIQMAFRQLNESAALQAAVVHGEDPDDNDRPGRRRLRL